jgi:hypothetical protein
MEKHKFRSLNGLIVSGLASLTLVSAVQAQSVGVGFAPVEIPQGFSLISNPLATGSNKVQDLITNAPDGFELIKLSSGTWQTNRYTAETMTWSLPDMTLSPGEGALASSPEVFTWNSIGKPVTGMLENFIPEGESLRASILPLTGLISTDLGFPTQEGLTLSTVDSDGNFSVAATFENGAWAPSEPVLSIGTSVLVTAPAVIVWNKDFVLADDDNPLEITAQPEGLTVNADEGFSLSVAASGASELSYQWQRNGNDIPGASAASYEVAAAGAEDLGSYSVIVFTDKHSIRSSQAAVEVILPEPEPEPEPEPPVVTPPTTDLTVTSRLVATEDGQNIETVITGTPGTLVDVEVSRGLGATARWRARARDLAIGETGEVIHTEVVANSGSLFIRVLPQAPELPAAE